MANEIHKILRILIENQEKRFSIRKLSKLRKINYKSAYNAIMKLQEGGLATLERIGNTLSCLFSRRFSTLVFNVEFKRREDLIKNKNFKVIYSRLKELNFPFIALLFGSFVKGMQNKHSDIDFLAITEHPKEIERTISSIPLNIHLTTVTNKEFMVMAKSKEFSVVSEAIKKNLILIGIEDYYRLLENAGC